jgi:hypothetical protein
MNISERTAKRYWTFARALALWGNPPSAVVMKPDDLLEVFNLKTAVGIHGLHGTHGLPMLWRKFRFIQSVSHSVILNSLLS